MKPNSITFEDLKHKIRNIGKDVAKCDKGCTGLKKRDTGQGIIPRCLILEELDPSRLGCVIVGINPGISEDYERNFLRENSDYESFLDFWNKKGKALTALSRRKAPKNRAYYHGLREWATKLKFDGSILWTELCKCEKESKDRRLLDIKAKRTCMKNFLEKELELVRKYDKDTPIIATGNEPYESLCLAFRELFIIGVPHITGARKSKFDDSHFQRAVNQIAEARKNGETCVKPPALWPARAKHHFN